MSGRIEHLLETLKFRLRDPLRRACQDADHALEALADMHAVAVDLRKRIDP